MLQRDDRPSGVGRPSLFSEAPDAPGEDKNILKQLDGLLAAPCPVPFWARWNSSIVAGLVALCAVVACLVWTSVRDEPVAPVAQVQSPAPFQPSAPPALPATPPAAAATALAAPAATVPSTVPEVPAASAAPVPHKGAVTQDRAIDKPHGRRHRHAARAGRDKPAAAERHGHKVRSGHAAATHVKERGKDKPAAHAEQKTRGKRQQHTQELMPVKRGTRGKGAAADIDAALIETVLTHGRATGVVQERARPGAGRCDPANGKRADARHHPAKCKTKTARKKAA